MKIQVNEEISLDDSHDADIYDKISSEYVTVEISGKRATVKIETLMKSLEAMEAREP